MIRNIIEMQHRMVLLAQSGKSGLRRDPRAVEVFAAWRESVYGTRIKFDPDQPRVPAGNPDGGQWAGGSGIDDPRAYPLRAALGLSSVGGALLSIAGMALSAGLDIAAAAAGELLDFVGGAGTAEATGADIESIAQSIEDWLGGKPDMFKQTDDGDLVIMKDDRKFRTDIMDPGLKLNGELDDPHFHLEIQDEDGEWIDAGSQHRYYFKK